MQWVTCRYCPKRFFKANASGSIEIVCPKCKAMQTQELKPRK
jgi:phage FluMu protein Com